MEKQHTYLCCALNPDPGPTLHNKPQTPEALNPKPCLELGTASCNDDLARAADFCGIPQSALRGQVGRKMIAASDIFLGTEENLRFKSCFEARRCAEASP